MTVSFLSPTGVKRFRQTVNSDPEFKLASRFLTADILLDLGDMRCILQMRDGQIAAINLTVTSYDAWDFSIVGPAEAWQKFLQPMPPPFYNGLFAGMVQRKFVVSGDLETAFAYHWAVSRMLDIARQIENG
jgi:hypothetical protein